MDRPEPLEPSPDEQVFRDLAAALVRRRLTGPAFEAAFSAHWRHCRDRGVRTSDAVDRLFTDVDAFCADPALREPGDLDEAGLREAVERFLRAGGTAGPERER
jgi:hypothetical protein